MWAAVASIRATFEQGTLYLRSRQNCCQYNVQISIFRRPASSTGEWMQWQHYNAVVRQARGRLPLLTLESTNTIIFFQSRLADSVIYYLHFNVMTLRSRLISTCVTCAPSWLLTRSLLFKRYSTVTLSLPRPCHHPSNKMNGYTTHHSSSEWSYGAKWTKYTMLHLSYCYLPSSIHHSGDLRSRRNGLKAFDNVLVKVWGVIFHIVQKLIQP